MSKVPALLLLGGLLAGCVGDGGLRLVVESHGLDGDLRLDALSIEVVASQTRDTEQAYTCQTSTEELQAPAGELLDLPVTVVIHPGEVPWRCVAVRLRGLRQEREVIRTEDIFCPDLDAITDERIRLEGECHADVTPPCEPGEVCSVSTGAPECEPSPVGSIFSVNPFVESECNERPD